MPIADDRQGAALAPVAEPTGADDVAAHAETEAGEPTAGAEITIEGTIVETPVVETHELPIQKHAHVHYVSGDVSTHVWGEITAQVQVPHLPAHSRFSIGSDTSNGSKASRTS